MISKTGNIRKTMRPFFSTIVVTKNKKFVFFVFMLIYMQLSTIMGHVLSWKRHTGFLLHYCRATKHFVAFNNACAEVFM